MLSLREAMLESVDARIEGLRETGKREEAVRLREEIAQLVTRGATMPPMPTGVPCRRLRGRDRALDHHAPTTGAGETIE